MLRPGRATPGYLPGHPPATQVIDLHEVEWPVRSGRLPPRDGYPTFAALCRAGLVRHAEPWTQVLPLGDRLMIRAATARAWRIAGSGVEHLGVAGRQIRLGPPVVRGLVPASRLESWLVIIKGKTDDEGFRAAAHAQLDLMGVAPSRGLMVGQRRVIRVAGATIVGFAARLSGLSPGDSLAVQSRGLGGRMRFGCGGFLPC